MRTIVILLMFTSAMAHATCADDLAGVTDAITRLESPKSLADLAREFKHGFERRVAYVLNLEEPRTYANTVRKIDQLWDFFTRNGFTANQIANGIVLPPKTVEAKNKAASVIEALSAEFDVNPAIYQALDDTEGLTGLEEDVRRSHLRALEYSGAHLAEAARAKLEKLFKIQDQITREFSVAMNEDTTTVELSPEELADQPETWVREHAPEGRLTVTKSSDVYEFLRHAKSEAVREKVYLAYRRRLPDNAQRLLDFTNNNAEIAKLFGTTHLERAIHQNSVAGDPVWVEKTLRDLAARLKPRLDERVAAMKTLKTTDGPLRPWDMPFFDAQLGAEEGSSDWQERMAANFFPAKRFQKRLFDYVATTFGIEFTPVEGIKTWDEHVTVFRVRDTKANRELGYIYFDPFSRPGKNSSGAAIDTFQNRLDDQLPIHVFTVNWGDAKDFEHRHLSLHDVSTALHEMGHAIHTLVNDSRHAVNGGFRFATDFTEMPSTALERLIKTPEGLIALSSHAMDGRPMSRDLAEQITRTKGGFSLFGGDFYSERYGMNTVFLSLLDLELQKRAQAGELKTTADLFATYRQEYASFFGVDPTEFDQFPQTFWHMTMRGYAGNYSAYVIANLVSANVYERINELGGLLDPNAVRRWREGTLEKPALFSASARKIIEDFLGRDIEVGPLLREQGLE